MDDLMRDIEEMRANGDTDGLALLADAVDALIALSEISTLPADRVGRPLCQIEHHKTYLTPMEHCASCQEPLTCGPFEHGCTTEGCRLNAGTCRRCRQSRVECCC